MIAQQQITETTGLENADKLIERARKAGLKVTVKKTDDAGDELVSGHTSVAVSISMHCPKVHAETMLGVSIQAESLIAFFYRSHRKGARAKFTSAEQRSLHNSGQKIKTLKWTMWAIEDMGKDMAQYFEHASEDLPTLEAPSQTEAPTSGGQRQLAPTTRSKAILRKADDGYGYVSGDGRWEVQPAYSPTHLGGSASRPSYWIISDTKGLAESVTRLQLRDAREFVQAEMKRDGMLPGGAKVVLVPNGYSAGYKSTCGTWDVVPIFGRRRRGVASSRPAFFTVRHNPSDTELDETYKNISTVRQAFACGKIAAPVTVGAR